MTTHVIRQRDWRVDEPREIRWNDETGEVSGDHGDVPAVRRYMEAVASGARMIHDEGSWTLGDPRTDPASFLVVLSFALHSTYSWTPTANTDDHFGIPLPEPLRSADARGMFRPAPPGIH